MTSSLDPNDLTLISDRDDLFETGRWPMPFAFNEDVVHVFDDMVSRSVPLYREVMMAAVQWTLAHVQPKTRVVDIGCSTGTFIELLTRHAPSPLNVVGVDPSAPMIAHAQKKLAHVDRSHRVTLTCADALDIDLSGASVVVMNYTLQFIPRPQRQRLLNAIAHGLTPGGLFFISEKTLADVPAYQALTTAHYEAFKIRQGYSRAEVMRKKSALVNVLVPQHHHELQTMLTQAGLGEIETLVKLHNFVTLVARKGPHHD